MLTFLSIACASLFVFLAGFNVWNMLSAQRPSARAGTFWIQVHRLTGYLFIALFLIFLYFMLLRVKGLQEELPPRLLIHAGLALLLVPLLIAKVFVARFQKSARSLLAALGIGIFSVAFTLVALNVAVYFLRSAGGETVPLKYSAVVAAVVIGVAAIPAFRSRPSGSAATRTIQPAHHAFERPATNPNRSLNLKLARVDPQTHDAKTLRFLLPSDSKLAARPGQFLTFDWVIDGKNFTRSYSICSSPSQTGFVEITAKRVPGGHVSRFLNDEARPGLTVNTRGPFGRFCFDEVRHKRIALLAGGSGITPMISILRYIEDMCIPAHCTLIYCVRTGRDVIFREELDRLRSRMPHFHFVLVLSQPDSDWNGCTGRLRQEILECEVEEAAETTFFLCGPPAFMEHARDLLKTLSVKEQDILLESFGGAVSITPGPVPESGPLKISFARSGIDCNVSPAMTLLESSEMHGILIPSGCRQGVCGTCATRMLRGKVQMEREDALTEGLRSAGYVLPCVSRPLTDVELDA